MLLILVRHMPMVQYLMIVFIFMFTCFDSALASQFLLGYLGVNTTSTSTPPLRRLSAAADTCSNVGTDRYDKTVPSQRYGTMSTSKPPTGRAECPRCCGRQDAPEFIGRC
ncbi:hypothetical protein BJX96DRAFT_153143 [Aspergillus floccosus]